MKLRRFFKVLVLSMCMCALGGTTIARAEKLEPKAWYSVNNPWLTFDEQEDAEEKIKSLACPWDRINCTTTGIGYKYTPPYWLYQMETRYQTRKADGSLGPVIVDTTKGVLIWFECTAPYALTLFTTSPGAICSRPDPVVPPCERCANDKTVQAAGNPIYLATGVKQQVEVDYKNASGTLRFVRTYRSDERSWQHNYASFAADMNRQVAPLKAAANSCVWGQTPSGFWNCFAYAPRQLANDVVLRRGNGRLLMFGNSANLDPAIDVNDRVVPWLDGSGQQIGLQVTNGDTDAIENYDAEGRIVSSRARNGQITTFTYSTTETPPEIAPSPGLLIAVTDAFGHQLRFTYGGGSQMLTMTDAAGGLYQYFYGTGGTLDKVVYPDGKERQYLYGEPDKTASTNAPYLLTGIIDENGARFATYTYDGNSRAASTEHAGGVEKFTATYGYMEATVIDPLGTRRVQRNTKPLSTYLASYTSQPDLVLGGTSTNTRTLSYDANGNVRSVKEFDDTTTNYTFDLVRNLETKRVEGAGSAVARTISTEWHPTFRLPSRVAEPKRITSYTYDDHGNVLTRTVRATTDATGASGFSATPTGTPQVWTYTYDSVGHVLTVKGPRTDVNATATFTYDAEGNLATQANAAGHVTSYSNYDQNGRVGRITDPNGLVTDISYKPRGWLASVTVGGEMTSYDYDGVGQVTLVTLPDGRAIHYTYDDAHRLTGIADTLGNSITYTLDNMGNRITEQTKDASGALTRQVTRVMDALNRVRQVTGALQ